VRLSANGHLTLDQYHVADHFSIQTDASSNNLMGTSTSLQTVEHYVGGRLEWLIGRTRLSTRGAVRLTREQYESVPVNQVASETPILDLDATTSAYLLSFEVRRTVDNVVLTVGGRTRAGGQRHIDLTQSNWNFLPPEASSDNPYIYQQELNRLFGVYHADRATTDHAGFVSGDYEVGRFRLESGLRVDCFGGLQENVTLSARQEVELRLNKRNLIRLYYGSFAESPVKKVLEPYQVLIHADYDKLRPIKTSLFSATWGHGALRFGAFYKRLENIPVLTPDFSQVQSDGTAAPGFLQMLPSGAARFAGVDVALDASGLFHDRIDVYSFYGYTQAVKRTAGVHTAYDLNAPHRLLSQVTYHASGVVTLGAEMTVRSGYAYTPSPATTDKDYTPRHSTEYFQSTLEQESSERFPTYASLDFNVMFDFGATELTLAVANVTNRGNPIINTRDGFIYDVGILPNIGLTVRF
jgi:hypothetical protein